jgi:hypothetical protein
MNPNTEIIYLKVAMSFYITLLIIFVVVNVVVILIEKSKGYTVTETMGNLENEHDIIHTYNLFFAAVSVLCVIGFVVNFIYRLL